MTLYNVSFNLNVEDKMIHQIVLEWLKDFIVIEKTT